MNLYDSGVVISLLEKEGLKETDEPECADIIIVNTCSVREHAETRALGRISSLQIHRREKAWLQFIVIGCMAERLRNSIPGVDFFIGPKEYDRLPETIREIVSSRQYGVSSRQYGVSSRQYGVSSKQYGVSSKQYGVSAFLPVMRGCDNFCSYCVVPYLRGSAVSRRPDEILDEFNYLKREGVKDVTLLGQSVTEYRFNGVSFPDLLGMIDKESHDMRIRFLTSHPGYISDQLIDVMAECPSLCENIHLPLQSGSNRILNLMGRGYTVEAYTDWVKKFRERIPNIAISTDMIVGFPTEEDQDFSLTLEIVERIGFDFAYMFLYSKRDGTKAGKIPDNVPLKTKKIRLQKLIDLQNRLAQRKREQLVGEEVEILVEKRSTRNNLPMGKTRTGKEVIIRSQESGVRSQDVKMGQFVKVYVNSISGWTPVGKIL